LGIGDDIDDSKIFKLGRTLSTPLSNEGTLNECPRRQSNMILQQRAKSLSSKYPQYDMIGTLLRLTVNVTYFMGQGEINIIRGKTNCNFVVSSV
jgi:hypothetical protein